MTSGPTERSLGDYRLLDRQEDDELCHIWRAEQLSVSRRVLVRELRPEQADRKQEFLAEIRAMAAVDHPLIGSVYEAVDHGGQCYSAHEWLPGETLGALLAEGRTLPPAELVRILSRLADIQLHCEAAGHATRPMEPCHIHVDPFGVVRIDNLAIAGPRATERSERDVTRLGKVLEPLVAKDQPATKRLLCLLGWMRGQDIGVPLTWRQIHKLCQQIEHQLAQAAASDGSPRHASGRLLRNIGRPNVAMAAVMGFLLILLLVWWLRPTAVPPAPALPQPHFIRIPAGNYPTSDGPIRASRTFAIAPHEVTIGQYAAFLDALELLKTSDLAQTYNHPEQPPDKTSHLPDDWPALLTAAKSSGIWRDHHVTLDSPVVGVDWWDATAYADWKKARLPNHDEWLAALHAQVAKPMAIPPAPWQPVTMETADRTPGGLCDMAGSVCEWTASTGVDPANPLGGRKWLIAGGSFLKPGSHALTREWADDRNLRRPDLGFRVVAGSR